MKIDNELRDLNSRLSSVIRSHCNAIGCDNCDLKYGVFDSKECSATDLQGRIMDIEMKQFSADIDTTKLELTKDVNHSENGSIK